MKEVHLLVQEAQVVRQEVLLQGIRVGDTRGIHSTEARDPQDHHQIMEDTTEDILLRLILEAILLEIEDQHQDLQDQATHLRASQAPDLAPMDPRPLLPRDPLSVMDPRTPGQENILQ